MPCVILFEKRRVSFSKTIKKFEMHCDLFYRGEMIANSSTFQRPQMKWDHYAWKNHTNQS